MSADNKLKQAGLDNWIGKTFCPAVETAIDRIKVRNNWVTDLSEGRQTSLNTKNDLREWIKDRVEEAEKVLGQKDIDIEELMVKPGMDFDDPINKLNTSEIKVQSGFREAYSSIIAQDSSKVLEPVIISGRGDNFLTHAIKDVVELKDVEWAGENGCIYHNDGKVYVFNGEKYLSIGDPELDYSKKVIFDREVWRKAAKEDRKIIWASSFSPVSGTLSIEGEGINLEDTRTGIRDHRFYGNEYAINSDTERIWNSIESAADARDQEHGFERENPMIIFEDTQENADLGIALDGDDDRAVFVNENSEKVMGDESLTILSEKYLRETPESKDMYGVVCSANTSQMLEDWITGERPDNGLLGTVNYQPVGAVFTAKKTLESEKTIFGGQPNGHLLDPKFVPYDSGTLPGAVMAGIIKENQILSSLQEELPSYEITKRNWEVEDKDAAMKTLKDKFGSLSVHGVHRADMYTEKIAEVTGANDKIIFRPSGTEPVIRLKIEHRSSSEILDQLERNAKNLLEDRK